MSLISFKSNRIDAIESLSLSRKVASPSKRRGSGESINSFVEATTRPATVKPPKLKADYVLCYLAKDINASADPASLPNKRDPTFVHNKQRLIFLENLASYGCEIEQVIDTRGAQFFGKKKRNIS
jgi:hypothetical protein